VNVVQRVYSISDLFPNKPFYGSSCMDLVINLLPGIQPVDSLFHLMVFSMLLMFSASVVTGTGSKSFYNAPRCWKPMMILIPENGNHCYNQHYYHYLTYCHNFRWIRCIATILHLDTKFSLAMVTAMVTVGMVYQPPAPQ
jgi:hypothetical protein